MSVSADIRVVRPMISAATSLTRKIPLCATGVSASGSHGTFRVGNEGAGGDWAAPAPGMSA